MRMITDILTAHKRDNVSNARPDRIYGSTVKRTAAILVETRLGTPLRW